MILKRMIQEEWRMHSTIFRGRSFAFFPVMVFIFSLAGSYSVLNYSTLGAESLSFFYSALAGFVGLSVGSLGFSSKDAVKNVLGPTNFLVYSSRTLPVPERRLLAAFLLKDLIYYSFLFLLPITAGFILLSGASGLVLLLEVFAWFSTGVLFAVILTRGSIHLPTPGIKYSNKMAPLAEKSFLDLWRSSGGLLKILFSFIVLAGFYWTIALYFPFAEPFMQNPLLSFSVLAGTISLTVYNWLNRFDSLESYEYLPVNSDRLLEAKQEAFLKISAALITLSILISFIFYHGNLPLAIGTGFATMLYTVGIAKSLTGLKPNERLFDTFVFLKYLLANSLFVMPLLILSVFYSGEIFWYYIGMMLSTATAGYMLSKLN
jgi:hypothetical protein